MLLFTLPSFFDVHYFCMISCLNCLLLHGACGCVCVWVGVGVVCGYVGVWVWVFSGTVTVKGKPSQPSYDISIVMTDACGLYDVGTLTVLVTSPVSVLFDRQVLRGILFACLSLCLLWIFYVLFFFFFFIDENNVFCKYIIWFAGLSLSFVDVFVFFCSFLFINEKSLCLY